MVDLQEMRYLRSQHSNRRGTNHCETGHNCGTVGSSLRGCRSASILLLLLWQEENTIVSLENFE